jgi:hypothetical protein
MEIAKRYLIIHRALLEAVEYRLTTLNFGIAIFETLEADFFFFKATM